MNDQMHQKHNSSKHQIEFHGTLAPRWYGESEGGSWGLLSRYASPNFNSREEKQRTLTELIDEVGILELEPFLRPRAISIKALLIDRDQWCRGGIRIRRN